MCRVSSERVTAHFRGGSRCGDHNESEFHAKRTLHKEAHYLQIYLAVPQSTPMTAPSKKWKRSWNEISQALIASSNRNQRMFRMCTYPSFGEIVSRRCLAISDIVGCAKKAAILWIWSPDICLVATKTGPVKADVLISWVCFPDTVTGVIHFFPLVGCEVADCYKWKEVSY